METLMIPAFGRYVAVGMARDGGDSCVTARFGMSTTAQLDGAGVAGSAQPEKRSAHTIRTK